MQSIHHQLIIGLGETGLSCMSYLASQGLPFAVMDTRANPPSLSYVREHYPDVPLYLGSLNTNVLNRAERIILSPGIPFALPSIQNALKKGIPVIGDIELFAENVTVPVIGITGTNAKSTVTTLVGEMLREANIEVGVGGNLGIPALKLLEQKNAAAHVLELSSFQLETTYSLRPKVATVLNITPDHMDRYESLTHYQAAKHRVYRHCEVAVCNRDDIFTDCLIPTPRKINFTLSRPDADEFGLLTKNNDIFLSYDQECLLAIRELPIGGKHYYANALAAMAIASGFGLPISPMLRVLKRFKGLPHRCQLVRERNGVKWYNDSKGTNVGATSAAILGLGGDVKGKLIVILGGVGKGADFSTLLPSLTQHAKYVVLIGEASKELSLLIEGIIPYSQAGSMEEAVIKADLAASPNDCVLLSPACASFDMFKNFEHRGIVFTELVQKLST